MPQALKKLPVMSGLAPGSVGREGLLSLPYVLPEVTSKTLFRKGRHPRSELSDRRVAFDPNQPDYINADKEMI